MSSSHDSDHGHHGSPFIQHHFEGPQHQFDSGKMGIWLFLVTEVLFFSGLFVAYIIYRSHHPEIFAYANHYLDTKMGAVNTVVLLFSSLTAAWAVRCAQLNQQRGLIAALSITILCAFVFLGVKYVEYSEKFEHGTLWGQKFDPHHSPDGTPIHGDDHGGDHGEGDGDGDHADHGEDAHGDEAHDHAEEGDHGVEAEAHAGADHGDHGEEHAADHGDDHGGHGDDGFLSGPPPPNTSMFFSIYFGMTGLHGIHVTAGIVVFIWLLIRAIRGHFNSGYFGPIDYAALYWHLVDLIWIYLFPLLYLIH